MSVMSVFNDFHNNFHNIICINFKFIFVSIIIFIITVAISISVLINRIIILRWDWGEVFQYEFVIIQA